jgi:hypothetical protein
VTEGSWETLKACKLVGIDLCHAAYGADSCHLGRLVNWMQARSARRSVRGGQNLSARRVGTNKI